MSSDSVKHIVGGALGGMLGAIVTCPLEIVKTRQQSSINYMVQVVPDIATRGLNGSSNTCRTIKRNYGTTRLVSGATALRNSFFLSAGNSTASTPGIVTLLKLIVEREGPRALFKGLGPNLVGIVPSRAIFFGVYGPTKDFVRNLLGRDTHFGCIISSFTASIVNISCTNPIWFVKTRLQLTARGREKFTAWQCVKHIYNTKGILGFYKGVTASYIGTAETVLQYVLYEDLKSRLMMRYGVEYTGGGSVMDVIRQRGVREGLEFLAVGGTSKALAALIMYPHEVARTRLRQEGNKYNSFFQTLWTVCQEEGFLAMYKGLSTHLIRQVPNFIIVITTYETVVYAMTKYKSIEDSEFYSVGDFVDEET